MKLTFIGTRGEIEARTPEHGMHTALMISHGSAHVMIDCGLDWLGNFQALRPQAIVLTHAHPDHAWGLQDGAPCPVFAPELTWKTIEHCNATDRHVLELRKRTPIRGITFEPFAVEHSIRAPAVGYHVSAGRACFFYSSDVLFIPERTEALKDVQLYIGDGATISRSFVRKVGSKLVGHATVKTQLGWCAKEGVRRAIITHCGPEIVEGDPAQMQKIVAALAAERGIEACIAVDGMKVVLR
ncbi:MAG TPA: MBL fold metallo-hydrolase [Chthoniobacteraceae bacterium]|jgi:phosphoribosyl 1,2-cyclic phosphodiesterase|nr:MBL fold metallo-hydrolase [Chthoniobacteraceae bacterium]